jgi:uronate dehydrogenase
MLGRMRRLLVTGAAGGIGRMLRDGLAGYAEILRLSDIAGLDAPRPGEEIVRCDLADREAVASLVQDCDGVVHLGALSVEGGFDDLLRSNIVGTYNVYEAARRAGRPRILYASSNHVMGYHLRGARLGDDAPLRPDSLYGVSKCYGEALARYYFDKFGVESVCVRIGSCFPEPRDRRMLSTWLSPDDCFALVRAVFDAPEVGCLTVYGVSANRDVWWNNDHAALLGWRPRDSSERFRAKVEAAQPPEDPASPATIFQGGKFVAAGHFED